MLVELRVSCRCSAAGSRIDARPRKAQRLSNSAAMLQFPRRSPAAGTGHRLKERVVQRLRHSHAQPHHCPNLNTRSFGTSDFGPIFRSEAPYTYSEKSDNLDCVHLGQGAPSKPKA